jgi:hypothetical protein
MALARSIAFSIVASVVATAVARRAISGTARLNDSGRAGSPVAPTIVIVVPMVLGNSNNRIGYVREDHHHHRRRRLLGRGRH